jgi:hypothetical protein
VLAHAGVSTRPSLQALSESPGVSTICIELQEGVGSHAADAQYRWWELAAGSGPRPASAPDSPIRRQWAAWRSKCAVDTPVSCRRAGGASCQCRVSQPSGSATIDSKVEAPGPGPLRIQAKVAGSLLRLAGAPLGPEGLQQRGSLILNFNVLVHGHGPEKKVTRWEGKRQAQWGRDGLTLWARAGPGQAVPPRRRPASGLPRRLRLALNRKREICWAAGGFEEQPLSLPGNEATCWAGLGEECQTDQASLGRPDRPADSDSRDW